jgi:hypothetical protein
MYGSYPQPDPCARAAGLLEGDVCIWCEAAPKADTSHLCETCRVQDPEGVLRRPYQLRDVGSKPRRRASSGG